MNLSEKYIFTDSHKKNLSIALKGHVPWNRNIRGYTTKRSGQKHTEETKKKMKENHWSRTQPKKFNKFISNCRPNNPTKYEELFYEKFKDRYKMVRQKKIGTYCCDFYIPDLNLIVEIDGYEKSKERKDFIKNCGYELLHLTNEDVQEMTKGIELPEKPKRNVCGCGCGETVKGKKAKYLLGHHLHMSWMKKIISDSINERCKDPAYKQKLKDTQKKIKERLIREGRYEEFQKNKGRKISESKKGKKPNVSEKVRKERSEFRTKMNIENNPSKNPEVKLKLKYFYDKRITLPNRKY